MNGLEKGPELIQFFPVEIKQPAAGISGADGFVDQSVVLSFLFHARAELVRKFFPALPDVFNNRFDIINLIGAGDRERFF